MVRRVGWTAAAAALLASTATLVVAVVASDRRAISDAKRDALDRARAVLEEVEGDIGDDELSDELSELVPRRFLVAVYLRGRRIAGAEVLPPRPSIRRGCRFVRDPPHEWLLCGASDPEGIHTVLAGEPRDRLLAHRGPLMFGGLVALLVVALGAVFGGMFVARWSLRPLVALREALEALQVSRLSSPPALPRSQLREIDIVVVTLQGLLCELDAEVHRARLFAANAAHELRTPLTKIRTELELMVEDREPRPAPAERTARLLARVEQLGELVERLLVLAAPTESLRPRGLVSLAATVESVLETLPGSARVRATLEDDGIVRGDAALLASVVSNAIGNALKFSDGPVDVRVAAAQGEVVIRIDDVGQGLSEEARERAFDGFYRAREHRATPGHGVGLALIAHVVGAHGGTAAFVDERPGAHLEIRLPRHLPKVNA